MKKIFISIFVSGLILISTTAFAGLGAEFLYGPWFDDSQTLSTSYFRYVSWIEVSNPHETKTAKIKVSYYQTNGARFPNTTSFTKEIPPKGNLAWTPHSDLNIDTSNTIQGSYVIQAIQGSINGSGSIVVKAGDQLPGINTEYAVGDQISASHIPLESRSSQNLHLDDYWTSDNGKDKLILNPPDYVTCFYINNPNDWQATIDIYFYKYNGEPFACNLVNNVLTPVTLNIAQHETKIIYPLDYGVDGSVDGGPVFIEATSGSVIAGALQARCTQALNHRSYQHFWTNFDRTDRK